MNGKQHRKSIVCWNEVLTYQTHESRMEKGDNLHSILRPSSKITWEDGDTGHHCLVLSGKVQCLQVHRQLAWGYILWCFNRNGGSAGGTTVTRIWFEGKSWMHEENQLNWQITGLENHSQCRTPWDHMEMPTAISLSLSLSLIFLFILYVRFCVKLWISLARRYDLMGWTSLCWVAISVGYR
jgi:hypothetical protein